MFVPGPTVMVLLCLASSAMGAENCHHNNCYRAFNGDAYAADAKSFCSSFTTATTTNLNGLPTNAAKKCSLVAQISSVCECAYPAGTFTPSKLTSAPPGAVSTTIPPLISSAPPVIPSVIPTNVTPPLVSSAIVSILPIITSSPPISDVNPPLPSSSCPDSCSSEISSSLSASISSSLSSSLYSSLSLSISPSLVSSGLSSVSTSLPSE
ncbi:hypothetical protein VTL71DRAFT_5124 [Oculimacula yallundae]|uniref:Uncharacterized protein n=1 Tax=Oculimacula yallundae TaxID=86028 RepID=A0ABR4C1W4_9HELO